MLSLKLSKSSIKFLLWLNSLFFIFPIIVVVSRFLAWDILLPLIFCKSLSVKNTGNFASPNNSFILSKYSFSDVILSISTSSILIIISLDISLIFRLSLNISAIFLFIDIFNPCIFSLNLLSINSVHSFSFLVKKFNKSCSDLILDKF